MDKGIPGNHISNRGQRKDNIENTYPTKTKWLIDRRDEEEEDGNSEVAKMWTKKIRKVAKIDKGQWMNIIIKEAKENNDIREGMQTINREHKPTRYAKKAGMVN